MINFHLDISDIPRMHKFPLKLSAFGYFNNAIGIYNGRRPNNIEFVLRISSPEEFAIDKYNGVEYRNRFPHVLVRMPGIMQNIKPFAPRKVFYMIFDMSMHSVLLESGIALDMVSWPVQKSEECGKIIQSISELAQNTYEPLTVDRIDCLALRLLQEYMLLRPAEKIEIEDYSLKKFTQTASYIRHHYREKIVLEELPEKFGLSRRSFFRYWSNHFSVSPKQYLMDLKMVEAARLLEYDQPISDIANELNINDQSRFSECFKKYHKMNPRDFRKRIRED